MIQTVNGLYLIEPKAFYDPEGYLAGNAELVHLNPVSWKFNQAIEFFVVFASLKRKQVTISGQPQTTLSLEKVLYKKKIQVSGQLYEDWQDDETFIRGIFSSLGVVPVE